MRVFSVEDILKLAEDNPGALDAQRLARREYWQELGTDEVMIWGTLQNSKLPPVMIRLSIFGLHGDAVRCRCNQRKPCEHGLALMLMWVQTPHVFAAGTAPLRAANDITQFDPFAAMQQGFLQLERWLSDLVRVGFANTPLKQAAFWDVITEQMFAAGLPGLSQWLRDTAAKDDFETLTTEFSRIALLVRSFERFEELSGDTQADMRDAVGLPIPHDELSTEAASRDRWIVIGVGARVLHDVSPEEFIWLYGLNTRRMALLHNIGDAAVMHTPPLAVGQVIDAELVYLPSRAPLKAFLIKTHGHPHLEPLTEPVGETIPDAINAYESAIALNPWLRHYPLMLRDVYVTRFGKGWTIRDAGGQSLRISPHYRHQWALYGLHGGAPIQISGVWDGRTIFPLSVQAEHRWIDLNSILPYKRTIRNVPPKRSAMPTPQDVNRTLMSGAVDRLELHERANDPLPLPTRAAHEEQAVCSTRAMRHLSLILSGTHSVLLKEWLITAARVRRRVSPEVLPLLLSLGLRRAQLQPYLLPVIGERGRWLATEIRNQNWRWVFDPAVLPLEAAVARERERENSLIEYVQKNQFTLVVNELAKYCIPWSMALMDVFLGTMERIERPTRFGDWWIPYYVNHLTPLMYFFPLNSYGETQRRFQQSRVFDDETIHHRLQTVGGLRRDLFDALQESEHAHHSTT